MNYKQIGITALLACTYIIGGQMAIHAEERPIVKPIPASITQVKEDPEWSGIMDHLLNQDIPSHLHISPQQRELLTLAILTALPAPQEISSHVENALKLGATPEEIRETLLQTTPYAGYPKTKASIEQMYQTFKKRGVRFPLPQQGTVTGETRYEKGLEKQVAIAGDRILRRIQEAPADEAHIHTLLAENCFGDYYTRNILSLKERELITFVTIATLGGADPQVRGHVAANLQVGNTRQDLLDAITVALPYMGYPRTLNALAAINAIVPAETSQKGK